MTGTYAYDVLGRQTSIPGVDTQAGGSSSSPDNVTFSYRSDDLVATMSQGAACEGFTYDPSGDVVSTSNYASSCTGTPTTTSTNDYAGSSAPAWTTTTVGSTTSTTAYVGAITQGDALNVTLTTGTASPSCLGITTATCTMNLTDLRGNVIATASLTSDTSVTGYSESTEFGLPRSASTESTVAPVYGWLGTHEKAANNLSGLVVMVVRIYNPVTGLFTSPDPVYQGNANPYVYPSDPVNEFDLSGLFTGHKPWGSCSAYATRQQLINFGMGQMIGYLRKNGVEITGAVADLVSRLIDKSTEKGGSTIAAGVEKSIVSHIDDGAKLTSGESAVVSGYFTYVNDIQKGHDMAYAVGDVAAEQIGAWGGAEAGAALCFEGGPGLSAGCAVVGGIVGALGGAKAFVAVFR